MAKSEDDGLVIVYTGDGKGKTTAALGLCVRAVGHGNKIRIIQFIKSDWEYGEIEGIARLGPEVEITPMGAGCIGILGDNKPLEEHRQAARRAFELAREVIESGEFDIVILDEINIAVHFGLIDVKEVIEAIEHRPRHLDVVLTGRYAKSELVDLADLVTEMHEVKHPFRQGRLSKKGIDY